MNKIINGLVVIALILMMALSGCAGLSNTQKAETAVSGMFEALKESNLEKISQYVSIDDYDSIIDNSNQAGSLLYQHLNYHIISSSVVDENTILVNTEIEALNINDVYNEMIKLATEQGNNLSDDDYMYIFQQAIESENIGTNSQTIEISVINYSGTWKVSVTQDLKNAMSGLTID